MTDRRETGIEEPEAPHHPPIPDVDEPVDAPNEDPVDDEPEDDDPLLPGVV